MSSRLVRWSKSALISLLVLGIALVLLEGLSSAAILGYQLLFARGPGLHSRIHVRYDATLGWVNLPDLRLDDMYGSGRHFVTNDRSFRNDHRFSVATPPGRLRVLCSGDSFTLGIGGSNEDTFCAMLERLDPRLETANLGEAGYGIGQTYLKYEKLGRQLDHDLHVFAFISSDIHRLRTKRFLIYDKPRVVLRDGQLHTENVPVPRRSELSLFIARNKHIWSGIRTLDLARRINAKLFAPANEEARRSLEDDQALPVTLRVFEEIARINEEKGSLPVFVYLMQNLKEDPTADTWRRIIGEELEKRGLMFIDLVEAFQELSPHEQQGIFDSQWHHYTVEANRRVAELIYARLLADPRSAAKLR